MASVELYSKEGCPYCHKAKSLLRSKSIAFDEIDITRDADRELEMIKRSNRRTVPQVFIEGKSVGGYDDLAQLNASGELEQRLGISPHQAKSVYDVIVIGAGPAGLTAAMYSARKNLKTLIVATDIGGQMGDTSEIANFPGFQLIKGPELVQRFNEHADKYDIEKLVGERVVSIETEGRCRLVQTESGKTLYAKAVIITTGALKRRLNIPGELEYSGKGVVYCSTCDGPLFKDLPVAIIGGGNGALEATIEMNGLTDKVYLISRSDLSGDFVLQDKVNAADNVEIFKFHEPVEIVGEDSVEQLKIKNLISGRVMTLPVQGVFIEIGLYPNTDFVIDLLETNDRGEIKVDAKGYTGVRGIFAAGDATDAQNKQIVIAAGSGATAALSAFEYLVSQV